jgi:gamma-glutamyltranspeptidase/glutathione hydrolase
VKRILLLVLIAPAAFGGQVSGTRAAIATSSRFATMTGLAILRSGGNAADAAVATAFALSVAEPESAGIGGGGMLVYYDAKSSATWTLDFRENAPAGMTGSAPREGIAGAAVPSVVAGMGEFHRRFGSRTWKELVTPAARAANADLAAVLDRVATNGARSFYNGPIPANIVEQSKKLGGALSLHDFSEYKAVWRAPVQIRYGDYDIASVAPPSAGGLMLAEMLNIAAGWTLRAGDTASVHLLAESERRAAFDRDRFFSGQASLTQREMLSADHAKQWRASIDLDRATPSVTLGDLPKALAQSNHTSHFTIVDAEGNIACVTVSMDDENGAGLAVPGTGFALNDAAKYAARSGERVPSSMAPAIVFRDGKPILALGSAGGLMTPAIVLQVIFNVTKHKQSLIDAVEAPRFDQQASPEDITYESGRAAAPLVKQLAAMGHGVRPAESIGAVNAILIEPGKLTAVADSRRHGVAGAM